jgi:ribonuclease Z
MRRFFAALLGVAVGSSLLATLSLGKPDKVDGVNVPGGRIPQEIKNNKYPRTCFPGTERLAADEMRIVALGTGMPNQSPCNAAASFLVELGNGESFVFDLGTE